MKNILRNSNFGFTKWCVALVAVGWMGAAASAQVTLPNYEPFNFTAGTFLVSTNQTASNWANLNTGDPINIASGNLSFNGLAASAGNKISFDGTGMDAVKTFTQQTTGTVYCSFILNVTSLGTLNTTGGYFFGLNEGTGTSYGATIWAKANGTGYDLGINPRTTVANTAWTTSAGAKPINTPILVVVSYSIVSGTGNDVVKMWINPNPGSTEPTANYIVTNTGGTDLANLNRVLVRQDSATTTPFIEIDEMRIGATWADVTPAGSSSSPSLTPSVSTLTGFTTTAGTASAAQTFTVTGSNLSANVTVTAPTGFEVASDGATFGGSATITQSGGSASGTISVRIAAATAQGSPSGTVTLASTGATTANVAVSGTVTAAGTPSVTVSPTSATGLTNYVGQASAPTNYTVTGTNLVSNLVVTASTNAIEVSTNSSTGFTNSFSLAPSGSGTLSNTVYVRISALAPAGAVSATVGNVSGLASNNFTVSGTVTQPALTLVLATNSVAENAGANATTGTVGIPAILGTDLVVNLVSTNTTAATVPSTVTITNGQTNATFAIAAVASSGSFQPQTTAIEASNSNYTTASATLTVTNVDVPTAPLAAKGWINEFHYDNTGTDAGEFVEIVLADTTPTTNVSVILYNGGTAGSFIPYGTASDLASFTKGVSANGYTIYSKSFPVDGIQNGGTDGIALIIDNVVEEFISYEGSAVATSGAAAGYTSKDIGISEEPPGAAGGSLYRYGPGSVGRDFAWAKATVATPGQVNAGQNLGATGVQGTGTLAIANTTASSPFLTQNIFPKATAGQTVSLTLTGTLSSGTISSMSVVVPAAFTGLSASNVTVSGTGAGSPVTTLSGSTLTITGLVVDQLNPVTINITGLTTPETAGDLTKDGNYPFTVQTGVDGNLQSLLIQPIAVVTIPIANLGDVDANGVSLDVGKTVAVQGVCTEENFNSTSSTSAYLQSGQPDGVLKAGINIYSGQRNLFVRGDEYVVTGSVLNYNGLTELVVAASSQVVRLGTATTVPTPVTLTIAQLTAAHEAYEGSLVRVAGLSKVSGTWALTVTVTPNGTTTSGSNIILANGGVNLTARLNVGSTALTEPIYPTAITGIYGQFVATSPYTGGGQIQPRDQADIEDAPGLRLAFAEGYLYESTTPPLGGAIVSGALTVSRTGADTSAALVVALSASPTGLLQFPASVTIPAGQESAIVTVEAIDNSAFDAAEFTNVTLTGSALGSGLSNGSATITILEDEASAPADTIKPVITLIGANPQLVANGGVYTDLKATVTDNVDASREITGTGTVNTAVAGDYTITYNTSDAAGNAAIAVTRTVRVAAPLGTTYSGWLGQAGASDAAFLDYVFGAVTPGTLDPSLRPTVAVTGGNLVLTYNVRQGTTGLTVMPKMSADLATGPSGWVTTDVTVANVGAPREVNGVSVQQKTASVPVSGAKKFLRVEAIQQ